MKCFGTQFPASDLKVSHIVKETFNTVHNYSYVFDF